MIQSKFQRQWMTSIWAQRNKARPKINDNFYSIISEIWLSLHPVINWKFFPSRRDGISMEHLMPVQSNSIKSTQFLNGFDEMHICAFILLTNKKQTSYQTMFQDIIKCGKVMIIILKPKMILCDFELQWKLDYYEWDFLRPS